MAAPDPVRYFAAEHADIDLSPPPASEGALVTAEQSGALTMTSSEGASIRSAILALVTQNPYIDVSKVEALLKMQAEQEDRQAKRAFTAAFVRLQGALPAIKKDGRLEYAKDKAKPDGEKYLVTKYAKWEDILAAITPIMADHGFSLRFDIAPRAGDGGGLMVAAILEHEAGHTERGSPIPVALDTSGGKNNTQSYGSAMSYGQRYSAKAMLNLRWEGDDDDGVASGGETLAQRGEKGKEMALRIKELVDRAKLAGEGANEMDRKAALLGWFTRNVSYPVGKYLDIRVEDYERLVRLLHLDAQDGADGAGDL